MNIGETIRNYRLQKGMSQGDIEKRTGLLRCYLSRVENGATRVSSMIDRLVRLVVLGLGEGLEQQARDVIAKFTEIQKPRKLKLIVDAGTRTIQYNAA